MHASSTDRRFRWNVHLHGAGMDGSGFSSDNKIWEATARAALAIFMGYLHGTGEVPVVDYKIPNGSGAWCVYAVPQGHAYGSVAIFASIFGAACLGVFHKGDDCFAIRKGPWTGQNGTDSQLYQFEQTKTTVAITHDKPAEKRQKNTTEAYPGVLGWTLLSHIFYISFASSVWLFGNGFDISTYSKGVSCGSLAGAWGGVFDLRGIQVGRRQTGQW